MDSINRYNFIIVYLIDNTIGESTLWVQEQFSNIVRFALIPIAVSQRILRYLLKFLKFDPFIMFNQRILIFSVSLRIVIFINLIFCIY